MDEKFDENKFTPLFVNDEKGSDENLHVDHLTKLTGIKGKWQFVTVLTVELSVILHSMQMFANKWLSFPVGHWCTMPYGLNMTVEEWRNVSSPLLPNGAYDTCNIFDIDYTSDTERPEGNATDIIPCTSWEYDHSMFSVHHC